MTRASLGLLATKKPGIFGALDVAGIRSAFDAIRSAPDSDETWLGQPYRRWSTFLWSPLGADLLELSIPIFAAHGAEDESVPVESSRRFRDSFRAARKPNLRYVEYGGLDHSFREVATGRNGLPLLEIDLVGWLHDQGLVSRDEAARFVERVREAQVALSSHRSSPFYEWAGPPGPRTLPERAG